ncbi:MAG: NADH-quinone oxidoreductase subunit NuoK [Candidatus Thermoplasmatota archaeon]|nr:NADH-quinone oxidoreductase subunit NuoK [Candidatus Thermoplasmatota archaeon]MCL5786179.1 NADH-quinone oxidoreductase subunit NuoK [Candidatus Thermoplasmatota archaeon]
MVFMVLAESLSLLLFVIGLYGVMSSKVGIKMLISIEILVNAGVLNLVLVAGSSMQPIILALMVIAISAAESVVGLSILVAIYRKFGKVNISLLKEMKE